MTIKNITYFLPWFHEGFLAYADSVNARSRDDEIFVWFCGFVSVAIQQIVFLFGYSFDSSSFHRVLFSANGIVLTQPL